MEPAQLEIVVRDQRFRVYYQSGTVNASPLSGLDWSQPEWIAAEDGKDHLVVCECGQAVIGGSRRDGLFQLFRSYIMRNDGRHEHDRSTIDCNIIKAIGPEGSGWVMGKIVWRR